MNMLKDIYRCWKLITSTDN